MPKPLAGTAREWGRQATITSWVADMCRDLAGAHCPDCAQVIYVNLVATAEDAAINAALQQELAELDHVGPELFLADGNVITNRPAIGAYRRGRTPQEGER